MTQIRKTIAAALLLLSFSTPAAFAQYQQGGGQQHSQADRQARYNEMLARMKEEAKAYYADADTAEYGVRYRMKYLYNKANNLTFAEDRVVLIHPRVALDMSYESIGEIRWRNANPDSNAADPGLAYHLTPSYYFFYPESGRTVNTYRVIGEEFKLSDKVCDNKWTITGEEMKIGVYNCRKATLTKDGREWTAWFTTDLPHRGAPRNFNGLPGVVLQVTDADKEVCWYFNGLVENLEDDILHIKFPERFTTIPVENFGKVVRIIAVSEAHGQSYIQQSGAMSKYKGFYPEKFRPSTGIDACNIDNPIER